MRWTLLLVAGALAIAGCGVSTSTPASPAAVTVPTEPAPELVVLDWSDALNHELNEDAGRLFAPGAVVISGTGARSVLRTLGEATAFVTSFACQGQIVSLSRDGNRVTAMFLLGNRSTFACAAERTSDTATFTIVNGKIVQMETLPD